MRNSRRKNWFVKRVALGFAVAAVAAPAAQAGIDEGANVQGGASAVPRDRIEVVRAEERSVAAPQAVAAGFNWDDAALGAGLGLVVVLVGGGAAVASRRLGREQTA